IELSPGMAAGGKKQENTTPVFQIPNMADCDFYRPTMHSPDDPFLISYTGTLGRANRVEFLLAVAEACQQNGLDQVQFVIAGTGAEQAELEQIVRQKQLKNVTFTGYLTREQVRDLLNRSAATYTSFDVVPVLETNSPNKFFDSLAAGKLCIVNTKGWLQDLVETNRCGFYANPLEPGVFVQKLLPFLEDHLLLREFQENARKLAETEFSREKLSRDFVALFE
ncbi:MAG TPA: glycosyltransferase, partial [Adhaeribacter sp.]|nr:glycosyltransferase [Adhaeribacter sp.]